MFLQETSNIKMSSRLKEHSSLLTGQETEAALFMTSHTVHVKVRVQS